LSGVYYSNTKKKEHFVPPIFTQMLLKTKCEFHADIASELEAWFLGDFICCVHKSKLRQENSAVEFVEDVVEGRVV
jgi:hypothetical protein